MTEYLIQGQAVRIIGDPLDNITSKIPARNYIVRLDQRLGYTLEAVDDFRIPTKIYGETAQHARRILQTFLHKEESVGVLLVGEKGSGKTLLSKVIAHLAHSMDMPTILVSGGISGDDFNAFLQKITEPVVILFDEIDKQYKSHEQENLLSLLDGVFNTRKLFVMTSNSPHAIIDPMRNRPGRIRYYIEYRGITEEFMREYCADMLQHPQHEEQIIDLLLTLGSEVNFDMLACLVDEVNLYNVNPNECIYLLNIKPDFTQEKYYDVQLFIQDVAIPPERLDDPYLYVSPSQAAIRMTYTAESGKRESVTFSIQDMQRTRGKQLVYRRKGNGDALILTPQRDPYPNAYSVYGTRPVFLENI